MTDAPPPLDLAAADRLVRLAHAEANAAGRDGRRTDAYLQRSLRSALIWRSQWLADRYMERHGRRVFSGLFAGLDFGGQQSEGALTPKLLGTYEAELHAPLRDLAARGVERVVDVGCAEGYYAAGLARFLPDARVEAYDIDPNGRALCAAMAERNGVADRVEVRERFDVREAGEFNARTLLVMDVEGAEAVLLDDGAPEILRRADLIVETHPGFAPGVTDLLRRRFAATHEVTVVYETPKRPPADAFGGRLLSLDEFAATWEWRATPTPWLIMRPREE